MNILTDTNLGDLVTNTLMQLFGGAAFGGASNNGIYFSFSWPAQVLEEKIYQNPWTPTNPIGSMVATEYISDLTDSIPVLDPYYSPSGNTVPEVYEMILDGYTIPGDGATAGRAPSAKSDNADMPSGMEMAAPLADLQLEAQGLKVLPQVAVPNAPAPVALAVPTDAYLQQLAVEQQAANDQARQNLARLQQGLAVLPSPPAAVAGGAPMKAQGRMATAMSAFGTLGPNSLSTAFHKAQVIFTSTELASSRYPTLTFHATDIYPGNFADPAAAAAWTVFNMTYQLAQPVVQTVRVSFRFCRVDMVRAWMIPFLFSMQGWGVQGQAPGWLSTGSRTNNDGVFPLLPVSLIMGRDVVVTSQTDDIQYTSPGLQVLARVSKVLPTMPT
jgi:hypothetical protein